MGLFKRFIADPVRVERREDASGVEPRQVSGPEFERVVLNSDLPVVVDFWADWCGPCHMIAPSVRDLASEFDGRALVTKMNADENPEILSRYGIMGIPTLIYFQNGQEVDRVIGYRGYETLKSKLQSVLERQGERASL